jgi:hypothetical protein
LDPDEIAAAISDFGGAELRRVREAVERRRDELKQSSVVERPNHGSGILQLEYRSNPKTGTRRGPYRYFYWPEDGKQHSPYVGKTSAIPKRCSRRSSPVKIRSLRSGRDGQKLSPLLTLGRSERL